MSSVDSKFVPKNSKKQAQIKINLPITLKKKIEARADKYDFTIAGYLKHLAVNDLDSGREPVLKLSKASLKAFREAKKEEREGKLKEIKNVKEFFANIGK